MSVYVLLQYATLAFVRYTPKSGTAESYRSFGFKVFVVVVHRSFCCCLLETSILISIVAGSISSPTISV